MHSVDDNPAPARYPIAPMNPAVTPRRILITGLAGRIGRTIAPALAARGHTITGLDRAAHSQYPTTIGDIDDPAAVADAMHDVDTVIHLAARPHNGDFHKHLLQPNVIGMMNVCHAVASTPTVTRLILASTGQVHYGHRDLQRRRPVTVADGPAPTNYYALTKVWAEDTGRMLARICPHLTVIVARIGWFSPLPANLQNPKADDNPAAYLSAADTARYFTAAVECPPPPERFAITFVFSKPGYAMVDLPDTQRLIGYEPQDDLPTT